MTQKVVGLMLNSLLLIITSKIVVTLLVRAQRLEDFEVVERIDHSS